ncbi:sensor histidine kinase [Cohnella panacarvi]|uniref:sensor histidine kinase n=1 Tax=Cohnella panacarvi TaxID=400776 RepID=UPI000479B937|nr:ATP-binding protein [Cohnella panacarvi]
MGIALKPKGSLFKRRKAGGDLFAMTRKKLTLQYSGMLVLFLSLFIVGVYALLYTVIWSEQRSALGAIADSEFIALKQWSEQDGDSSRPAPREVEDAFSISNDQSFYYLIGAGGNVQLGGEIQPRLREQAMQAISQGLFEKNEYTRISMQTFSGGSAHDARFLVTAREIAWDGNQSSMLYIGKDVTFQRDLFRWLLNLLVGTALLFFLIALWFSFWMSRKAMIPIARSYAKQKEFAADASHELRTPLSVLLTSIEALQLELDQSAADIPLANNILAGMKEEVGSMTKLAGDLLQLARSDSGELAHNRSPFHVGAAATKAIDRLRPLGEKKNMTIELAAPADFIAEWDEEKFTQLLTLLVDNAVKYTPENGRVQVNLADTTVKGERVMLVEIKDSGMGIAPEALPHIFDRFYRQDKSRTRQIGGHGLGLAIVNHIVSSARGTVHVDSVVGQGTVFTVRLPI